MKSHGLVHKSFPKFLFLLIELLSFLWHAETCMWLTMNTHHKLQFSDDPKVCSVKSDSLAPADLKVWIPKSAQSSLTLRDPEECTMLASSVHGILQARILKWVAIPFSRDLSNPGIKPGSLALQVDSLPSEPLGVTKLDKIIA